MDQRSGYFSAVEAALYGKGFAQQTGVIYRLLQRSGVVHPHWRPASCHFVAADDMVMMIASERLLHEFPSLHADLALNRTKWEYPAYYATGTVSIMLCRAAVQSNTSRLPAKALTVPQLFPVVSRDKIPWWVFHSSLVESRPASGLVAKTNFPVIASA